MVGLFTQAVYLGCQAVYTTGQAVDTGGQVFCSGCLVRLLITISDSWDSIYVAAKRLPA